VIHYHGTPITPNEVFLTLAGNCFCVSHARPQQVRACHEIGQSVLLDNGAFTKKTQGREPDWLRFYAWCDRWLDWPTTWAVIPDEIDAGTQAQDALIRDWPHGEKGAPVWHMDEPVWRLVALSETWPRVCIGSTGEFWAILGDGWRLRMDEAWNALAKAHRRTPYVHMLRGMQLALGEWPFASVDSSDVGQNHCRPQNGARKMADRWNAANPPGRWAERAAPRDLFEVG
jgi:hypothetical protein